MKKFLIALCLIASVTPANSADGGALFGGEKKSNSPIAIDADALEVFQADKKAIFSGNVIAKQDNMTVKSNKMTVFYAGDAGNNEISKIELDGNVYLTTQVESARAGRGVYNVKSKTVTLLGDVTLTKDKNILKGNRLDFNSQTGYSKLTKDPSTASTSNDGTSSSGGRVRGLFIPESK